MAKLKIKKGDQVVVITGRDKGKTGEVLRVFPTECRLIVQGVHIGGGEQVALVGPALLAVWRSHPDKLATRLKNLQTIAVFDGGYRRRLQWNVAADFELRRPDECLANTLRGRWAAGPAAGEYPIESGCRADLRYGTEIQSCL